MRFLRTLVFAADMLWGRGDHVCPGPATPLARLCVDSGAFLLAVHTFSCQVLLHFRVLGLWGFRVKVLWFPKP